MKKGAFYLDGSELIGCVETADRLYSRIKGLMGRRGLARDSALWIIPCPSIHTFFMRFPIDVFFLSDDLTVVRAARGVRPFKAVLGGKGAKSVVEIENGWLAETSLKEGDRLEYRSV